KRVIDGIVEGLAPTDNLARLAQTEGIALVVTASGEVSEVRQSAVLPKPASDRGTMTPVARADDLARVVDVSRAPACDRRPHAGLPSPSPVATIAIPARAHDLPSIGYRLLRGRVPAPARGPRGRPHP